jgi:hypothetical protein
MKAASSGHIPLAQFFPSIFIALIFPSLYQQFYQGTYLNTGE